MAPSAIAMEQSVLGADGQRLDPEVPRALETDELPGIVEDYRKAAALAKEAGFDGVEVHRLVGWLLASFNRRSSFFRRIST